MSESVVVSEALIGLEVGQVANFTWDGGTEVETVTRISETMWKDHQLDVAEDFEGIQNLYFDIISDDYTTTPAHIVRMLDERDQLKAKLVGLDSFLDNPATDSLIGHSERTLMKKQSIYMTGYLYTLNARLSVWEEED